MEKKYLDYEGLKTLVDRIKELGPGGGGGLPLVTEMPSNPSPGDMVCWGGANTVSYKKGALYEWVPPTEEYKSYYCYVYGPQTSDPLYVYLNIPNPRISAPIYDVWDKTQDPPVEVNGPATDISEIDLISDSNYNYVASIDISTEPITITFGPSNNELTAVRDINNDISGTLVHPGYWKEIIIYDNIEVVTSLSGLSPTEGKTILYLGTTQGIFEFCHIYGYFGGAWHDATEEMLKDKADKFQYDELPSTVEDGTVIQDITDGRFYKGSAVSQEVSFSTISDFISWIQSNGAGVELVYPDSGEADYCSSVLLQQGGQLLQFLILPSGFGIGLLEVDEFQTSITDGAYEVLSTDGQVQDLGELTHVASLIRTTNKLQSAINSSPNIVTVEYDPLQNTGRYIMGHGLRKDGSEFTGQFISFEESFKEFSQPHLCCIETDKPLTRIKIFDSRIVWLDNNEFERDFSYIMYYPYGLEWKPLSPEPIPTNDIESLFHGPDWTPASSETEEP